MTFQIQKAISTYSTDKAANLDARSAEKSGSTAPWSVQKHVRLPYKPGLPLSSGGGGDGGSGY